MKYSADRKVLLAAVHAAGSVVTARSTIQELSMVRLAATEGGSLMITGTDQEVSVSRHVPGATVDVAGVALVDPERLAAILKSSSDDTVTMDADEDGATIRTSDGRYKLVVGIADRYPMPPTPQMEGAFEIDAGDLVSRIRSVEWACEPKESTRWAVNGVLFQCTGDDIILVATDTKKLSATKQPESASKAKWLANLPAKTVKALLVSYGEGVAKLSVNGSLFAAVIGESCITSRMLEGQYPPADKIVPSHVPDQEFVVTAAEFKDFIVRSSVMVTDESKRIDCVLTEGKMIAKSRSAETGDCEVSLSVGYSGDDLSISFDPEYLLDMVKRCPGADVTCQFYGGDKPAVFRSGDSWLTLVMPLCV